MLNRQCISLVGCLIAPCWHFVMHPYGGGVPTGFLIPKWRKIYQTMSNNSGQRTKGLLLQFILGWPTLGVNASPLYPLYILNRPGISRLFSRRCNGPCCILPQTLRRILNSCCLPRETCSYTCQRS